MVKGGRGSLDFAAGSATTGVWIILHDPRMTEHFGEGQSVVWLLFEKLLRLKRTHLVEGERKVSQC